MRDYLGTFLYYNICVPIFLLLATILKKFGINNCLVIYFLRASAALVTFLGWLAQPIENVQLIIKRPWGRVTRDQPTILDSFTKNHIEWHQKPELLFLVINTVLLIASAIFLFIKSCTNKTTNSNVVIHN